jgi:hypothetical protein
VTVKAIGSEDSDGGPLDICPQQRIQAIPRRHIDFDRESIFQQVVDRSEVDQRESAGGIVVNEQVEVAVGPGFGGRAQRPNGRFAPAQALRLLRSSSRRQPRIATIT